MRVFFSVTGNFFTSEKKISGREILAVGTSQRLDPLRLKYKLLLPGRNLAYWAKNVSYRYWAET